MIKSMLHKMVLNLGIWGIGVALKIVKAFNRSMAAYLVTHENSATSHRK